jgi:Cys-rich protein (TIGR01571 family)
LLSSIILFVKNRHRMTTDTMNPQPNDPTHASTLPPLYLHQQAREGQAPPMGIPLSGYPAAEQHGAQVATSEYPPGAYGHQTNTHGYPPSAYGYPPGYAYPPNGMMPHAQQPYYNYPNQMGGAMAMAVPGGASYPSEYEANGIRMNSWESGFADCCRDCIPNCCMSWSCPHIWMGIISVRIGQCSRGAAVFLYGGLLVGTFAIFIAENYGTFQYLLNGWELSYALERNAFERNVAAYANYALQLIFFGLIWQARANIRNRFRIPGNACEDCCLSACCSCCVIAQIATHVKTYKPGSCTLISPTVLPPYNPQ